MTLRSNRQSLWRELYTRYLLEPSPAEDGPVPGVTPTISPVFEVSDLYPITLLNKTLDLTGSAGAFVSGQEVPVNQRWHLAAIGTPSTTANTQLLLRDPGGVILGMAASGTSTLVLFDQFGHLRLDAGWELGLAATGNGGDSSRILRVLFYRERLN